MTQPSQPSQDGNFTITANNDIEYIKLTDGEPYKFHIASAVYDPEGGQNFETGAIEPRVIIDFALDETEGQGQKYRKWFTPSIFPKSNLAKLVNVVMGQIPSKLEIKDLEGLPLRATVKTKLNKENQERQHIDLFLAPSKDQQKVEIKKDAVVAELPTTEENAKAFDEALKVFEGAEVVSE